MKMEAEQVLRIVKDVKEDRERQRHRLSYGSDLARLHLMLGGEDACQMIEDRVEAHAEALARMEAEQFERQRTRQLTKRHRDSQPRSASSGQPRLRRPIDKVIQPDRFYERADEPAKVVG